MTAIVVTRTIAAPPELVFAFFTDLDRWTAWQGVGGNVDARPGGELRVHMPGGQVAAGEFVELVPHTRIVFTWGWEGDSPPVAAGSTTVVVELEPVADGTLVRLTHHDLAPPPVAEHHRLGWERYLDRLQARAEGRDPGADVAEPMPS